MLTLEQQEEGISCVHYTLTQILDEKLPSRVNDAANIVKNAYLGFMCSYTTQLYQLLKKKNYSSILVMLTTA